MYLYAVVVTENTGSLNSHYCSLFLTAIFIFEDVSSTTLTKHSYAKLSHAASRVFFVKYHTCKMGNYYGLTLLQTCCRVFLLTTKSPERELILCPLYFCPFIIRLLSSRLIETTPTLHRLQNQSNHNWSLFDVTKSAAGSKNTEIGLDKWGRCTWNDYTPILTSVINHYLDQGCLCCFSSFLLANQQTELCREGAETESEGLNADGSCMFCWATKAGAGPGLPREMVPQTQTLAHEYKDGRGVKTRCSL